MCIYQLVIWSLQVSNWQQPAQDVMPAPWRETVGPGLGKHWAGGCGGTVSISRPWSQESMGATWGFCFVFIFNGNGGLLSYERKMFFPLWWNSSQRLASFYPGREVAQGIFDNQWSWPLDTVCRWFNYMLNFELGNMSTTSAYWNREHLKLPKKSVD